MTSPTPVTLDADKLLAIYRERLRRAKEQRATAPTPDLRILAQGYVDTFATLIDEIEGWIAMSERREVPVEELN